MVSEDVTRGETMGGESETLTSAANHVSSDCGLVTLVEVTEEADSVFPILSTCNSIINELLKERIM